MSDGSPPSIFFICRDKLGPHLFIFILSIYRKMPKKLNIVCNMSDGSPPSIFFICRDKLGPHLFIFILSIYRKNAQKTKYCVQYE